MKVKHAFKRDKSGKPLEHDISNLAFASLKPINFAGRRYNNGGWVAGDDVAEKTTAKPIERAEKTTAKPIERMSIKEIEAYIKEKNYEVDTAQPKKAIIESIKEIEA